MKKQIAEIPIIGLYIRKLYRIIFRHSPEFKDSKHYWDLRYKDGGNSGDGSYNELAQFKADVLNSFVREERIFSVIEFGSGDGNQLKLASYRDYIGLDVSPTAIDMCNRLFAKDPTKKFKLMDDYAGESATLSLSLDVVYHLVEDSVFEEYMRRLFDSSERFVVIYSSNHNGNEESPPHVRHRIFTDWVKNNRSGWSLLKRLPNRYPYKRESGKGSWADFYFYQKS